MSAQFLLDTNIVSDLVRNPQGRTSAKIAELGARTGAMLEEGTIRLREAEQTFRFGPFRERPVASLLRGFSAPATVAQALSLDDRLTIARAEPDLFARWAATDALWRDLALAFAGAREMTEPEAALKRFAAALDQSLASAASDPAFAAELLKVPTEADLVRHVDIIDPARIAAGRKRVRQGVAGALKPALLDLYRGLASNAPYDPSAASAGRRSLRNGALALLVEAGEHELADRQAATAANMTDEAAATAALALADSSLREHALDRFYMKWRGDPLVVNKWLGWRAMAPAPDALAEVRALTGHEAFDRKSPNKVRALIGVFAGQNLAGFHRADGAGYAFFADEALGLDATNPQLAARLMSVLESWRKLEPGRRRQAEAALRRIIAAPNRSANLYEMASRLLGEPA